MTGIIATKKDNGFGFIKSDALSGDLFFHGNALVGVQFNDINVGDAVSFEVEEVQKDGEMKKNAVNVQRV